MGHEYNEMIDILSESINLTESIPSSEGLIEEFEPIFADEYSNYNPSFDPYQIISEELMNPTALNLEIETRRGYAPNENPSNQLYHRRNSRRANSLSEPNIVLCSYERSRPNNFMPTRSVPPQINESNNSTQTQSNSDSIQEDTDRYRQHNLINRDRRRESNICNKIQGSNGSRQTVQTSEYVGDSTSNENSSRGANSQQDLNTLQYLTGVSSSNGTNDIECDCLQCLPGSSNLFQNKRRLHERNRICKLSQRQSAHLSSSSQRNSIEPLPGPSGMASNVSNVTQHTVDSSDSENDSSSTSINHRIQSDVLTAPELQLDCFSDSSSDDGDDVIAIDTPSAFSPSRTNNVYDRNSNISHDVAQSRPIYHRNRNESPSSQSTLSRLPTTPATQTDNYRCPYNPNYHYSQVQRNNYCSNNNRYYPDARAPNAPDFGRNSVFNSSPNFNNNNNQNNSVGHTRSYGRWLNRGDNHFRRRFFNYAPRPSTYIPHQRLWHQQHLVQEMYRRFMSNNYEEAGRQYNNHGLSVNYNSQTFNSYNWHRRGFPVHLTPNNASYPHMRLFHSGLQDDEFSRMYVPPIRRYPNRGASQETIENHTLSYKFSAINENFDNEKCSICLSPFEENTFVRRLPCMHFYHRECIEQWLQLNSTCPICRIDIQKARNI